MMSKKLYTVFPFPYGRFDRERPVTNRLERTSLVDSLISNAFTRDGDEGRSERAEGIKVGNVAAVESQLFAPKPANIITGFPWGPVDSALNGGLEMVASCV